MAIVANTFSCVIGADSHARTHTLAALEARTGAKEDVIFASGIGHNDAVRALLQMQEFVPLFCVFMSMGL